MFLTLYITGLGVLAAGAIYLASVDAASLVKDSEIYSHIQTERFERLNAKCHNKLTNRNKCAIIKV